MLKERSITHSLTTRNLSYTSVVTHCSSPLKASCPRQHEKKKKKKEREIKFSKATFSRSTAFVRRHFTRLRPKRVTHFHAYIGLTVHGLSPSTTASTSRPIATACTRVRQSSSEVLCRSRFQATSFEYRTCHVRQPTDGQSS